ncbi:MAG: BamA/TamA family outer membrane protein [Prevotella sp.]|nr:BamA/TamA family outer membrane protein [Prevotella sp.]
MRKNVSNIIRLLLLLSIILLWNACSSTKFVPENEYLLERVSITADTKGFDVAALEPYIRQKANSKWFSAFKIPLGVYSAAGRDSTKWINRMLQRIGEEPVLYDTLQARLSCSDLQQAMQNLGYMHATVDLKTHTKGKKIRVNYRLSPGEPFFINRVTYDIADPQIKQILDQDKGRRLQTGDPFTVPALNNERKRITQLLTDSGYYRFHKDFIQYTADSVRGSRDIDVTLHLLRYRANSNAPETDHPRYRIRQINYLSNDSSKVPLRESVLVNNTTLEPGAYYSSSNLQKTYNNFGRLGIVRFTNIGFTELADSNAVDSARVGEPLNRELDCHIQLSTNKPNSISFQPEGTNTAGDLGAAASLTYQNRNLFRGSELLSIELRAAFEAITGLEGYENSNYEEYGIEARLEFPRFMAPFLSKEFKRKSTATSQLAVSYNLQNRPEFHRRVFSTSWRYRWTQPSKHMSYGFDVLDLNYVNMPWISQKFKEDYLDDVTNRNAILRYNYEDLFIMKIGFAFSYNDGVDAVKTNVETAGNILNGLSHMFNFKQNEDGQYTLFNIAYAQYVKFDVDYTHLFRFDANNSLALHAGFGIAYPYGNSKILPFEKRYFSGGANSVRGWSVRELGPGKFKGTDGNIDFINQTGDMKLDLNAEYRTKLFWKFQGALFIDAGNIWTLRDYPDQPGGQFKFKEFYKQIAVSYGLGLRLNFDYFILRMDGGMKAINPVYDTSDEHWAIFHPKWGRDFTFHFSVGLPF